MKNIKEKIAKNGKFIVGTCLIVIAIVVYLLFEFGSGTEIVIEDEGSNYNNALPYQEKEIAEVSPSDSYDAVYKDSLAKAHNNGSYLKLKKQDSINQILKELDEMSFKNTEPVVDRSNIGGGSAIKQFAGADKDPYLEAQKEERARERREFNRQKKIAEQKEIKDNLERQRKNIQSNGNDFFANSSSNSKSATYDNNRGVMDKGPTDERILASMKNDQVVKQGERVVLVLENEYVINGVVYPRNTKVYGIVSFGKNRVKLAIEKINHDVVNMYIEDAQDGLEGVYVEGANILGEGINESVGDGLDQVNVGRVPVGSALKNILRKKNKEIKVQLLNDYYVLLKPTL